MRISLTDFFLNFFIYVHMCAYVDVYHMFIVHSVTRRGRQTLWAGAIEGDLWCGYWAGNSGTLEKHSAFLTVAPSLWLHWLFLGTEKYLKLIAIQILLLCCLQICSSPLVYVYFQIMKLIFFIDYVSYMNYFYLFLTKLWQNKIN